MKLGALCILAASANGLLLKKGNETTNATQAMKTCGPQTKVCLAGFTSAAGDPQWSCPVATTGTQVDITEAESANGAIVCGPGKFYFSPMTCSGGRFEYKKQATVIQANAWSGGTDCPGSGETVAFPYKMACYAVEC